MCLCRICKGQKDKNGKIILSCIAYLGHMKYITDGNCCEKVYQKCVCISLTLSFLMYLTDLITSLPMCSVCCHVY